MIVNHFKMRTNVLTYNLAGMGCSAGVIAIGLAQQLLQVGGLLALLLQQLQHAWRLPARLALTRPLLLELLWSASFIPVSVQTHRHCAICHAAARLPRCPLPAYLPACRCTPTAPRWC